MSHCALSYVGDRTDSLDKSFNNYYLVDSIGCPMHSHCELRYMGDGTDSLDKRYIIYTG